MESTRRPPPKSLELPYVWPHGLDAVQQHPCCAGFVTFEKYFFMLHNAALKWRACGYKYGWLRKRQSAYTCSWEDQMALFCPTGLWNGKITFLFGGGEDTGPILLGLNTLCSHGRFANIYWACMIGLFFLPMQQCSSDPGLCVANWEAKTFCLVREFRIHWKRVLLNLSQGNPTPNNCLPKAVQCLLKSTCEFFARKYFMNVCHWRNQKVSRGRGIVKLGEIPRAGSRHD